MAIVRLTSKHPAFSYLISKNPASPLWVRAQRAGRIYGWYSGEFKDSYNIYFEDSDTDISYPASDNPDFHYLGITKYTSALAHLHMLDLAIAPSAKTLQERDSIAGFEIFIPNIKVRRFARLIENIKQNMSYGCEFTPIRCDYYSLNIFGQDTLEKAMANIKLLLLIVAVTNGDAIQLNADLLKKYAQMISLVDPPYFMRYLFKARLLNRVEEFMPIREQLVTSARYPITMEFGDTQEMRFFFVRKELKKLLPKDQINLIDFGCGSGSYLRLLRWYESINYIGIDQDEVTLSKAKSYANYKYPTRQTEFATSIDYYKDQDFIFLSSEVIEHNEPEKAKDILNEILKNPKCRGFLLTTPNRTFNRYFNIDTEDKGELRHLDHKHEYDLSEFVTLIQSVATDYNFEFHNVGDVVDGTAVTIAASGVRK